MGVIGRMIRPEDVVPVSAVVEVPKMPEGKRPTKLMEVLFLGVCVFYGEGGMDERPYG